MRNLQLCCIFINVMPWCEPYFIYFLLLLWTSIIHLPSQWFQFHFHVFNEISNAVFFMFSCFHVFNTISFIFYFKWSGFLLFLYVNIICMHRTVEKLKVFAQFHYFFWCLSCMCAELNLILFSTCQLNGTVIEHNCSYFFYNF